ncbi:hypothetical protein H4R21_002818, partial [Coemansia helicoidea]
MWNTVNKYDADGNLCPPTRDANLACPALCVYDLGNCPQDASCPDGQTLCHDGRCHDECTPEINSDNPCFCGWKPKHVPSAALALVPCPLLDNVTVGEMYQWQKTEQVRDACSAEAGIGSQRDFGTWDEVWPRRGTSGSGVHGVWADCPKEPQEMYTFREPMWIAVFTVVFGYVALLGAWYAFKTACEMIARRQWGLQSKAGTPATGSEKGAAAGTLGADEKGAVAAGGANDLAGDDIRLTGFRNNVFGTAMAWLLLLLGMAWLCFIFVLSADYYGKAPGTPAGQAAIYAYYDSTLEAQTFIVMWCLFVFLAVTVNATRFRLRNFFRIKTLPQDGGFVCVEHRIEPEIMLAGQKSYLVDAMAYATGLFKQFLGWDWAVTTCPLHKTATGRTYFAYQCTRFVFDEAARQFAPFAFDLGAKNSDYTAKAGGLTTAEADERGELIGPNFIHVNVPNWFMAFVREITTFIALFQLMALLLMFFDYYWQVGLVDMSIILLSFGFSMVVRKLSEERLKRMAEQDDRLMVLRDGAWDEHSTRSLVPGDVIQLSAGMHMSCDCVLISGNAIMDEASLTGEALPIRKFPLRMDDSAFSMAGNKSNQLFAGTIVSQALPMGSSGGDYLEGAHALALVARTGTASDKGQLVRKILFPQPISFIFDQQLKVVFAILIVYVFFCLAMAIYFYDGSPAATWFYFMFCGLQAMSPLLPAGLLAGQSMAVQRLKRKQIFCVEPRRVLMGGKVQLFCFDKTGTLTREGLEFYGVQPATRPTGGPGSGHFGAFAPDLAASDELFQAGIASCHAVTELEGQLIGNPVDIEQFRASRWSLDKDPRYLDKLTPPAGSPLGTLHVVRRFEFVHARASMSVVVMDERTGQLHVFVKGSFERLKAISAAGTIPDSYDATCSRLAREGCYVLAIAHRPLDASLEELRHMSQEDIEAACDFAGLLVFKNMLKDDTAQAIGELKRGSTRTVMITGDTALTGIYIARQCGMSPPDSAMLLGDVDKKTGDLVWTNVDTDETVADPGPCLGERGPDGFPTTELAVTCAAFRALDERGQMAPLLLNTRIFARMKPDDKVRCVRLHMERGITAMCGDGGNDCGALRAAHVGLALSDAEASIVSPFASANRSIMSCVELLIQSRAGLATSFANYRALILYGTTMTMSKLISFYFADSMSANIWMVIDSLIVTSMAIAVTFLPPARKLAKYRPTARILGPEIMASVLGVVAINWIFMACVWIWTYRQSFFRCHEFDSSTVNLLKWYLLGDNYEAAIMTYVVIFQFINNGLMVNYGYLYRRWWFFNPLLLGVWAMLVIIFSYAELAPPSRLS